MEPQVFKDIELAQLANMVKDYKERAWRLTNLCGSSVEGKVELLYSFSADEELENLRVLVANDEEVPAVSPLYPCAFMFENETHDLYGVRFTGMTLNYEGAFYPTSVPTPMNPASAAAERFLATSEADVADVADVAGASDTDAVGAADEIDEADSTGEAAASGEEDSHG
jgi:ech hydrogenase subunit D